MHGYLRQKTHMHTHTHAHTSQPSFSVIAQFQIIGHPLACYIMSPSSCRETEASWHTQEESHQQVPCVRTRKPGQGVIAFILVEMNVAWEVRIGVARRTGGDVPSSDQVPGSGWCWWGTGCFAELGLHTCDPHTSLCITHYFKNGKGPGSLGPYINTLITDMACLTSIPSPRESWGFSQLGQRKRPPPPGQDSPP